MYGYALCRAVRGNIMHQVVKGASPGFKFIKHFEVHNTEVEIMPKFRTGEMFQSSGYIVVTTNSFLTTEGKLVMGRGAAWQLKQKVPGIDKIFGKLINENCGHLGCYGLIFFERYGAAQVKYRFDEKANLELITHSMTMLSIMAGNNNKGIYNINYPGIGNGGLKENEVRPIIEMLPDNVHVWKKKETW